MRCRPTLGAFLVLSFLTSLVQADIDDRVDRDKYRIQFEKTEENSKAAKVKALAKAEDLRAAIQATTAAEAALARIVSQRDLLVATEKGLIDSNKSLRAQIVETARTIQLNEASRGELLATAEGLKTAIGLAKKEADAQQAIVATATQTVTSDKADVREATTSLSIASAAENSAQDTINSLSRDLTRLRGQLKSLEDTFNQTQTQRAGYDAEMIGIDQKKGPLEDSARDIARDLIDLDGRIRRGRDAINAQEAEVDRVHSTEEGFSDKATKAGEEAKQLTQQKPQKEKAATDARETLRLSNVALAALEVERGRLEDVVKLMSGELDELRREETRIHDRLHKVEEHLKDAVSPEKEKLEAELASLKKEEARVEGDLKKKNDSYQADRQSLLAIPQAKADLRKKILNEESVASKAEAQLTDLTARLAKAIEDQKQNERSLKEAVAECDRQEAKLNGLIEQQQKLNSSHDTLRARGEKIGAELKGGVIRKAELEQLLKPLLASLGKLELETIPAAGRDITRAEEAKEKAETALKGARADRQIAQRKLDAANAALTLSERDLSVAQKSLTEKEAVLTGHQTAQARAISRRAELLTANGVLEKNNADAEAKIVAQAERAEKLSEEVVTFVKPIEAANKAVTNAKDLQTVAQTASDLAAAEAARLESDTKAARLAYVEKNANYESAKTAAIALASSTASAKGTLKGAELANPVGDKAGTAAGKALGGTEGGDEGKARDYEAARAVAHAKLLGETVASKGLETPEQEQVRKADAKLNQSFLIGQSRGQKDGEAAGLKVGDNFAKEKEGRDAGYAQGKRNAQDEAERTHRKLGAAKAESDIRAAEPQKKESRDALKEEVSSWIDTLRQWSTKVAELLIPSVIADTTLGSITDQQVPVVETEFKGPAEKLGHPDFDEEYKKAYGPAYQKAYSASYKAQYKQAYVKAYDAARAKAKAEALAIKYEDEEKRGTRDGSAQGTFEGLGYNAGEKKGFADGKASGEAKAFARGQAEGLKAGYGENLAQAQEDSFAAGEADVRAAYRNSVRLAYRKDVQKLNDADGDGKFELNEKVALTGVIRNFGGLAAAKGKVSVEIDPATVKGIKLAATSLRLGEIAGETEVELTNLLVGTVLPGSVIALKGKVVHDGQTISELEVAEKIHAPYRIVMSYIHDPNAKLRVASAADGSGHQNAFWVASLGGAELLKGISQASITPVDNTLSATTWGGGGGAVEWMTLQKHGEEWLFRDIFVYAKKRQGLEANKFRVRLRNAQQQILFDQILDAPIEMIR